MDKIRVALADDHALVLDGLELRLRDMDDLELVGTATSGDELLKLLEREAVDVAVMDLHMAPMDGFEVLSRVRAAGLKVRLLVLTAAVDGLMLQKALELGADGIAMKTDPPRATIEAIRQVARGQVVYPQAVHNWLLRRAQRGPHADPNALTAREEEVLALVAEGLTNHDIAARLTVSENTVKYHMQNLYSKLHVTNRTEAARLFYERRRGS